MFGLFGSGPKVHVSDVEAAVKKGDMVLVDVRDVGEVAASGMAKGAINVPVVQLQMKANPSSPECMDAFKHEKTLMLYCASGARSAAAAQMLRQMGHKDVQNFGGLRDWAQAGGELVRA